MKIALHAIISLLLGTPVFAQQDYSAYHQTVLEIEELIAISDYEPALRAYEELFSSYNFIILRDYKIAAQLAEYEQKQEQALQYVLAGIRSGLTKKELRKHKYLSTILRGGRGKTIGACYDSLRNIHLETLNWEVRSEMQKMYKQDQWKAFQALFKFSSEAQDRFAENKFAPGSEVRVKRIIEIIDKCECPGEKLTGNSMWLTTIAAHHASISTAYNQNNQLYELLMNRLASAVTTGGLSPYEYALIQDWYISVATERTEVSYGHLNAPRNEEDLETINWYREKIGMRSIQLRNQLVDVQTNTGMDFELQGGPRTTGKIEI